MHGGDGGDGIHLTSAQAQLLDSQPAGGAAGTHCCLWPGLPGQPSSGSGTVNVLPGQRSALNFPSPLRESTTAQISVEGTPGELAYLYLSRSTAFQYMPSWKGVWLTASPYVRRLQLGVIPPSGTLATDYAIPDLGPGNASAGGFVQTLRVNAVGNVTLGNVCAVTILDSIY